MPVLVDIADVDTGEYEAVSRRFAWGEEGPDLSSTLGGAGGIGGMAIAIDEEANTANGSTAAGPMMATYDGNIRLHLSPIRRVG